MEAVTSPDTLDRINLRREREKQKLGKLEAKQHPKKRRFTMADIGRQHLEKCTAKHCVACTAIRRRLKSNRRW